MPFDVFSYGSKTSSQRMLEHPAMQPMSEVDTIRRLPATCGPCSRLEPNGIEMRGKAGRQHLGRPRSQWPWQHGVAGAGNREDGSPEQRQRQA